MFNEIDSFEIEPPLKEITKRITLDLINTSQVRVNSKPVWSLDLQRVFLYWNSIKVKSVESFGR